MDHTNVPGTEIQKYIVENMSSEDESKQKNATKVARYQQKEEGQNQKKNVMKHELKVPKAGQLDAVKASRLRQLSSNQLKGFRIRT